MGTGGNIEVWARRGTYTRDILIGFNAFTSAAEAAAKLDEPPVPMDTVREEAELYFEDFARKLREEDWTDDDARVAARWRCLGARRGAAPLAGASNSRA